MLLASILVRRTEPWNDSLDNMGSPENASQGAIARLMLLDFQQWDLFRHTHRQ